MHVPKIGYRDPDAPTQLAADSQRFRGSDGERGDMLARASDGYYRSTPTGLSTPRGCQPLGGCSSNRPVCHALFLQPQADVLLTETATAKDFLQRRLREIGLL